MSEIKKGLIRQMGEIQISGNQLPDICICNLHGIDKL